MKHRAACLCLLILALSPAAQASDVWLPVKDISLVLEPGSVLDFSSLNPLTNAIDTRLVASNGHLARADAPDKPIRFLMGSLGFNVSNGGYPSHAMADLYAHQFRMHGYNMARLDFIEYTLMTGRIDDFDFDPVQLDRLYYLLYALKREGIYYMLNGLSSGNGGYGNIPQRWIDQRHLQLGVYVDPKAQLHWKTLMQKLFAQVNPYTSMTILADPALAGLIMVNEGGLAFTSRNGVSDLLRPPFAAWLRQQYGTTNALRAAWNGELKTGETIEAKSIGFPKPDEWTSHRMADTQRFFVSLEKTTADWMTAYLRTLGYMGLTTAYNNWLSPAADISRAQFVWTDMHEYFAEPTNGISAGSVMPQGSLLLGSAAYVRDLGTTKHVGKAFSVSEYGQVFWNRYRRESGLAVPTYAAFQGWDAICQHAGAVTLSFANPVPRREIIGPFDVGIDPVARASETLAALLYMRGDVAPARRTVGIRLTQKFVFDENAHLGSIPGDISRLVLVTGTGLDWTGTARYDAWVTPDDTTLTLTGQTVATAATKNSPAVSSVADTTTSAAGKFLKKYGGKLGYKLSKASLVVDSKWASRVDSLRQNGLIGTSNLTDPAQGVYQTDTGQVVMDSQRKRMTVITPNTEAVVFDAPVPINLDKLKILQADGPALVSVSSLDGQPVHDSKRLLLILATDARNSNMKFSDTAETTLQDLGTKPVLIRAEKIAMQLATQFAGSIRLYSTNLRGQRGDAIPVTRSPDGILFTIDTAQLAQGPTTFFELTARDDQ